jgi:NADH-quinone oxidoreductase subunit E
MAGETTQDGEFTLGRAECLGACANAVAIQVGGRYIEDVRTPEQMDRLLDELRGAPGEAASPAQSRMPEQTQF